MFRTKLYLACWHAATSHPSPLEEWQSVGCRSHHPVHSYLPSILRSFFQYCNLIRAYFPYCLLLDQKLTMHSSTATTIRFGPPPLIYAANAKDWMGNQIQQMDAARQIQLPERVYGWFGFRIEAFVESFIDLVCIASYVI
jgi:hypothetical protein